VILTLLLVTLSILISKIEPVKTSSEGTTIIYKHSTVGESTSSYDDSDPVSQMNFISDESNVTFSSPDANGVINITVHKGGGPKIEYNPITNTTQHVVPISDAYGKMYTNDSVGDVDIISMTNDTGTFFKNCTAGTWHPAGEGLLGNGDPDPAGSAWYTQTFNQSIYHGNGTDGPLLGSFLNQIWFTTGFSENTVLEPASRLNGFYVNATGAPFNPPLPGGIATFVYTRAKLNIPWWQGKHLDFQGKTDSMQVEPPAFMASLFSPANLYVTDPLGNHIGTHPTTEEEVNEIPNAFYSGSGTEPQRIVIPDPLDGVYDIRIIGTDNGSYSSLVEYATDEKMITHSYTGNISVGETLESQATISEGEMTSTPPSAPAVGGIYIPVNKLELLAPYIGLTIMLAVAVIAVVYVKKRKRELK